MAMAKKAAADLKLMIEVRLQELHPECVRAEVIISPPEGDRPWNALVFGTGPTINNACRKRIEGIVGQLRHQFDLA